MATVMLLKNRQTETILRPTDFEDVLDKYLGSEAADYFREFIRENEVLKADNEELEWKLQKYREIHDDDLK